MSIDDDRCKEAPYCRGLKNQETPWFQLRQRHSVIKRGMMKF